MEVCGFLSQPHLIFNHFSLKSRHDKPALAQLLHIMM